MTIAAALFFGLVITLADARAADIPIRMLNDSNANVDLGNVGGGLSTVVRLGGTCYTSTISTTNGKAPVDLTELGCKEVIFGDVEGRPQILVRCRGKVRVNAYHDTPKSPTGGGAQDGAILKPVPINDTRNLAG